MERNIHLGWHVLCLKGNLTEGRYVKASDRLAATYLLTESVRSHVEVSVLCVAQRPLVHAPQLRRPGSCGVVYGLPSVDDRPASRAARNSAGRGSPGGLIGRMAVRDVPLIVVGCTTTSVGQALAARLRRDGCMVCVTHSADGCLRVATSVRPDAVLLDPQFPRRVERLLRAHPASAGAQIMDLSAGTSQHFGRKSSAAAEAGLGATAAPHAA